MNAITIITLRPEQVDFPIRFSPAEEEGSGWEADGIHMNVDGYRALGVGLAPAVKDVLGLRSVHIPATLPVGRTTPRTFGKTWCRRGHVFHFPVPPSSVEGAILAYGDSLTAGGGLSYTYGAALQAVVGVPVEIVGASGKYAH